MNTQQHDPTPWFLGSSRLDQSPNLVESPHGIVCAVDLELGNDEANAAHIVHCVNLHDELVAALRALRDECVKQNIKFGPLLADADAIIARADTKPTFPKDAA